MKILPKVYRSLPTSIRKRTNKLYKYLPSSNKTIVKTIDGIKYELDLGTLVHAQIYHYGCWEPDTTKLIETCVKEGMTVFDIGASTGPHTLRMAKLVGPKGKVYAFEPSSELYPKLIDGVLLNDFKNIVIERVALSDKEERKLFYTNSLCRIKGEEIQRPEYSTMFTTLDLYTERFKVKYIDFIKLDVDGHETKILKGAQRIIKKSKPIMIVEFARGCQEKYGNSIEELKDIIESFGYSFYSVKTLLKYDDVLDAVPETGSINVLCLLGDKNENC